MGSTVNRTALILKTNTPRELLVRRPNREKHGVACDLEVRIHWNSAGNGQNYCKLQYCWPIFLSSSVDWPEEIAGRFDQKVVAIDRSGT